MLRRPPPAAVLDCVKQPIAINRLCQIGGSTERKADALVVHNRNHDDRNFGKLCLLPHGTKHRPSVHLRHKNIEGYDVGAQLSSKPQSLLAVCGYTNGVTAALQMP